jgi:PKD repeat protein
MTEPEVGQEVYFHNKSHNAVDFEWDFGDGVTSTAESPVHVFTGTGSFDVILKVYSKNGTTDEATITINVLIPTLLEIEVLEFYQEYAVAGASVWLYPTLIDWEDQTNVDAEGFTDSDGIVVFSHLGPWVYYVDVWEATHDNYALKQENIEYIRTDEIIPNKINRFLAYVDVADHSKGKSAGDKTSAVIKLVKRPEKDRSFTGTSEDWQSLYNRSIKLK